MSIYKAVASLEARFHGRRFTPDGHLVGSLGEVVAADALDLALFPMSEAGHDGRDAAGVRVQIKTTAGKGVALYSRCERLVVLQIASPQEAEIVYDGPGDPVWERVGKRQKNGQHRTSLARLREIAATA